MLSFAHAGDGAKHIAATLIRRHSRSVRNHRAPPVDGAQRCPVHNAASIFHSLAPLTLFGISHPPHQRWTPLPSTSCSASFPTYQPKMQLIPQVAANAFCTLTIVWIVWRKSNTVSHVTASSECSMTNQTYKHSAAGYHSPSKALPTQVIDDVLSKMN